MNWFGFLVLALQLNFISACLPTQFTCESGQCVDGARFCDGTVDCADGTDEHHGCTNCNRTYYGMPGVKYPLRLNEPVRQASGSVCTLSFIAAGGEYGDLVEITFLSFHIGVYKLESAMCYNGYMEVEDKQMYPLKKRSVRFVSGTRKKSSVNNKRKESLKVSWDRTSLSGAFCGKMIGDSATFYSSGDKVNLNVFVSSHVSAHSSAPRLYLTYRFFRRESLAMISNSYSNRFPETSCNVTLTNCSSQQCVIRSPNYPGFYLRNLTCLYRIKQDYAPPGQHAQVEVFQPNEFKINLLSGHTSNGRFKSGILTADCAGDIIKIYDGATTVSPLLASFCGSGSLPAIRSSGPDIIIESRSVPFQPLFSSKFELNIRIHFVPNSVFRMNSGKCSATFDGSRSKSGILKVPDHSIAANTTCTFRINGRRPSDRIWLYFVVYSVPDLHPWTNIERCDVAQMRIIYPKVKLRHAHHHSQRYHYVESDPLNRNISSRTLVGKFCEKTSPLQCGHASDFEDFVPSRPCDVITESYLSSGPELILELTFLKAMAILGSSPHFVARYEVVEVDHPLVPESTCTVEVRSSEGRSGWLENPRNLFLYGRGGSTNLSCKYELRGDQGERVRVVVRDIHFAGTNSCTTVYDAKTQRYSCAFSPISVELHQRKKAVINVTELWRDIRVAVGCICDAPRTSSTVVLETVSNKADLEFIVINMDPRDDFRTFRFELAYEFVASSSCQMDDHLTAGVEGQVKLSTHEATRCRWLLVALPSRALYVTIQGRKFDNSCQNKYLFYDFFDQEPFAAFCASEIEEYQSVFTKSWSSESPDQTQTSSETGLTLLEVTAGHAGSFSVHWVEVTRRSRNSLPSGVEQKHWGRPPLTCELECPELDACISSDLACDGRNHCPETGADELPDRCAQFPVMTLAFSAAATVTAALLCCLLAFIVRQHRLNRRDKTHVPSCPLQLQHPLATIIKHESTRHSISERYA